MDTFTETVLKILMLIAFCGSLTSENYFDFIKDKHRVVPQIFRLKGHPYLRNCVPVKEEAKRMPFFVKNDLNLSPHWSNREEYDKHPDILNYFSWSYNATKTDVDPETEEIGKSSQGFNIMAYELKTTGKIHISAYAAKPGLYTVMLKVTHKMSKTESILNLPRHTTCYFYVRSQEPIPLIDGGSFRIIPDGINLTINGGNSLDPDKPLENNNKTLKFYWNCTQKLIPPTLCNTNLLSTAPEFTISPEKIIAEDKINITLRVENEYGLFQTTFQQLNVKPNAAALRIRCVKNCPPITKVPNSIFFASCDANCEDIREEQYEWSIQPVGTKRVFRGEGNTFAIDENILQPSTLYVVKLALKGSSRIGLNTFEIYYEPQPEVSKCEIFPRKGKSLTTWFRLECVEKPPGDRNNFYELYVDSPGVNIIASGFYPDVFESKFTLPPSQGHTFGVRVSKIGGPSTFLEVNPYVLSASDGKTPEEALTLYNNFYYGFGTSVTTLLRSKDKAHRSIGVERFRALVNEIINKKMKSKRTSEYVKELTYEVAENALKSNVSEILDLIKLSDGISKLMELERLAQLDPVLAKMATDVCSKMVKKNYENVLKKKSDQATNDLVQKTWTHCMEVSTPAGSYLLKPSHPAEVLFYNLAGEGIDTGEKYSDYIDSNENYTHLLDKFHDTVNKFFDVTALSAKTLAKSMVVGEKSVKTKGNFSATIVAKNKGKKLYATRFEILDTVLVPSADFSASDHDFDILMSVWTRDLLWWNNKETRVATNIISVQFWHSSCRKQIEHFNSSVQIWFNVKNTTHFQVEQVKGNVSVPSNFLELNDTETNKWIRVFRVNSPKNSVVYVGFHSIPASTNLDVVVTKFEFPNKTHFDRNKRTINSTNYSLNISNYHSYDRWIYIGILPNRNSVAQKKPAKILFFNLSFVLSYCIHWFDEKREWELDCRPGKNKNFTTISCQCRHFSILSGYLQNTEPLVQKVEIADIELELQVFTVIFITMVVTYVLFGLLLLSSLFRIKSDIYFLSDNIRSHRYGYLVLVRTGEISRSAGTTSNVMIRLIGSKRTSEPHVLNYPDPKLRLLQKGGVDMFILTTPRHLGIIKHIELWFDSTGASPEWFCRDIVIYDMQKRAQWFFRMRTWLNLAKNDIHYIRISPSDKEPPGLCNQFRICNHFHTWELWAREGNFSFIARLTTVFSNILLNYVFVLIMCGLPTMEEPMDCIDPHEVYRISWYHIHVGALCAFASFVIHVGIAWIYRVLLSLMIVFSSGFLIFYGFWVPTISSFIWLTCCIVGLLIDIILYENIFIVIQTFFCKFKLEVDIDKKFDVILQNIEGQRRYLYRKFDDELLRPFLSHLYRPLQRIQLIKRRITAELRYVVYNDLEDLVIYSVYNILLTVLVLYSKDSLTVITKEGVESMVEGEHTRSFSFGKIRSIGQVYKYLNETLLPVMHPIVWYANYSFGIQKDKGMMIDNANKFIGVARIMQHRVKANDCVIANIMTFLDIKTCWPEYISSNAETRDFGPRWSSETVTALYDQFKNIWKYSTFEKTDTWFVMGQISYYSGGGYVAFLGRKLYDSYLNFKKYIEMLWIDHTTRSVFVEFLTYNVNYNVFVAVRLLYEESATGYSKSSTEINVIRMVYAGNEYEQTAMIFSILYICWWAILMLKLIVGVYKNFFTIYKRFWLMVDLFINITTLVCIVLFFKRISKVHDYLEALENKAHIEFVSYFHLLYVEELLTYFNALLILVATARLWRFLRFGLFFRIMERTLAMAAYPLLAVTFAFTIIIVAFAFTGIIIFRDEFEELGFFISIVQTLIQMSLKPDQFDLTKYIVFQTAYIYFSMYLLFMQVILLLYVTVIIMAYMKAQLECSVGPDRYTVHDYVSEQIDYFPKLMKTKISRLRGGEIEDQVTPKADEFRYANSVQVRRSSMKSMSFIVSCIIRNMNQREEEQRVLTDYETHLMLYVTKIFVLGSYEGDDYELFFKGHFEGQKIQLIDEKRIDKISAAVRMIIETKDERKSEAPHVDDTVATMCNMIRQQNKTLYHCKLLLKLAALKLNELDEKCLSNAF